MSEKAYKALQEERAKALESQVQCAWCDKVCNNADHLFVHCLLHHPQEREWKAKDDR